MADWQIDQLLDELARDAARAPSTASRLFECPPATPTWEQRQLLERCVVVARAAGLKIPRTKVLWVQGRSDIAPAAFRAEDGKFTIAISTTVTPNAQALATLHELQHVSDCACNRPFDRAAWEIRAERTARALVSQI